MTNNAKTLNGQKAINEGLLTACVFGSIIEWLQYLSPREQKILRMHFGLDDGERHTLEEISERFGVTRERIRQVEARALQRLKKHYLREQSNAKP